MDCFQFKSSPCAPTAFSITAITSVCDIGFGDDVPEDVAAAGIGAAAAGLDAAAAAVGAVAGALACGKMADTMLPKMLMVCLPHFGNAGLAFLDESIRYAGLYPCLL